MNWFRKVWQALARQSVSPKPVLRVMIYSRPGCHLCDDAEVLSRASSDDFRLNLEKVDIDPDPQLCERYGDRVPVVFINDRERFSGIVNPVLLKRLLASLKSAPGL